MKICASTVLIREILAIYMYITVYNCMYMSLNKYDIFVSLNSVSWMMHLERILRVQSDLETLYLCRFVKIQSIFICFYIVTIMLWNVNWIEFSCIGTFNLGFTGCGELWPYPEPCVEPWVEEDWRTYIDYPGRSRDWFLPKIHHLPLNEEP